MRHFLRFGWAAAVGLAVGGTALGQTGNTGGTNSGTSNTGGNTTQNSGGTSGTAPTLEAPPTITGTSLSTAGTGRSSGGAVNSSNFLGPFYANPYYQGRAGATGTDAPGGFGVTLYSGATGATGSAGQFGSTASGRTTYTSAAGGRGGTSTGFGGTSTGFGGTSTGFGGTSSGFGGTSTGFGGTGGRGATGFGGQGMTGYGNSAATSAQVIAMPRQISYTAAVRFPTVPMTAPRMHTEARAVLDRSVSLSNPRAIEVVADGSVVVLRGTVRDEDEARLAENMIRLTPGVHDVKNELKFPNP